MKITCNTTKISAYSNMQAGHSRTSKGFDGILLIFQNIFVVNWSEDLNN